MVLLVEKCVDVVDTERILDVYVHVLCAMQRENRVVPDGGFHARTVMDRQNRSVTIK